MQRDVDLLGRARGDEQPERPVPAVAGDGEVRLPTDVEPDESAACGLDEDVERNGKLRAIAEVRVSEAHP